MFVSRRLKGLLSFVYVFLTVPFAVILMYALPKYQRLFRQICGKIFIFLFRIKVKVEGEFAKDVDMIVLNHQSFLDVIFLEAVHPGNLCWVAKKELGSYFLYGHALKAPKMILLDRADKRSLVKLFRLAKERLDEGRVLAIFPEGTRSKGKEKFLPFKPGAKMLIEKHELRYQPIIAVNTRNIFDIGNLLIGGGEALFVTMEVEQYTKEQAQQANQEQNWYDALKERMHQCYLKHYYRFNHDEV